MEPDVVILLGETEEALTAIAVYHQVLINASPVFKAMLKPSCFEEGTSLVRDKHLELRLPEDDAEAMTIICDIIHLRSRSIPQSSMTPELLYKTAVLVDKYDFASAIQPWPEMWQRQENITVDLSKFDSMESHQLVQWIHICCNMRYKAEFKAATSTLIQRSTGEELSQHQTCQILESLTPSLREEILGQRQQCIGQFHQVCLEMVKDLEKGNSCKATSKNLYILAQTDAEQFIDAFSCASMKLGNARIALRSIFGVPWRDESTWNKLNIINTYTKLQAIANMTARSMKVWNSRYEKSGQPAGGTDHSECSNSSLLRRTIDPIYEASTNGLDYDKFGHIFYRDCTGNKLNK